jgi:hypothetical protein
VRQRIAAAAAALGLTACDAAPPEPAPAPPEASPAAEVTVAEAPPDPAALAAADAIAQALRDPDPFERARRLAVLLPSLGPEGVYGVRQAFEDPSLTLSTGESELLIRCWAAHEPEAATRWAAERSASGFRPSLILAALPAWASADPRAALAAAQQWEVEPILREPVQVGLIRGWFERDPDELFRHIEQLEPGFPRQRAISTYLRLLAQAEGPEAVVRWAEAVPDDDPGFKLDVDRQVAVGLPNFDLDATLRWCDIHCGGSEGKDLRGIIAMRWAQLGGGAAVIDWLSRVASSEERDGALPTVFEEWARQDAKATGAWLTARIASGNAEPWLPAVFPIQVLGSLRQQSPLEAIGWAERVEDEKIRERLLIRVVRAWRWQDEAAAEAWLEASSLSEDARERVRKLPPVQDRLPKK